MNVARHSKRLLAALMASAITVVDVQAAVTDIFNQPLATTSTVVAKPNIMFIFDNSGSMASDYMPDDMNDTGKYGFKSAQCNGVAFDPTLDLHAADEGRRHVLRRTPTSTPPHPMALRAPCRVRAVRRSRWAPAARPSHSIRRQQRLRRR